MIATRDKFRDSVLLFLLVLIMSASSIRAYNNYVIGSDTIDSIIRYTLIILAFIFILQQNIRVIKPALFVCAIIFIILFHYFVFPENRYYINLTFSSYWIYLIVLFLCVYVSDFIILEKSFIVSAAIILFFDLLLFSSENYHRLLVDYAYGGVGAVFSYSLLYAAVVFLYVFKFKEKKWCLILSIVAAFIMIFYGNNRMAALCYLMYLAFVIFWNKGIHNRKTVIKTGVFMVVGTAILFNISKILDAVLALIGKNGYSSRIIEQILSNSFLESTGRNEILNEILGKLFSFGGFLGFGITGDRVITSTHQYAHNIFLEILVEFGWIVGLLVILLLLWVSIKAIHMKTQYNRIIGILFAINIFSLMISGTFWNSYYFWMFISICLKILIEPEELYENRFV